jgi:hypothetical protein
MDLERVSQLGGKERARLRAKVVERYPSFAKYQERHARIAGSGAASDVLSDDRVSRSQLFTLVNSISAFLSLVSAARNLNAGVIDSQLHRGRGSLSLQRPQPRVHLTFRLPSS